MKWKKRSGNPTVIGGRGKKKSKKQAEQKAKEQNISVDELDQEPKYVTPIPKTKTYKYENT